MAECRYCAFAVFPQDVSPGCEFGLTFRVEDHPCPLWERECGTDDDLGDESTDPLPVPTPAPDQR